MFQEKAIGVEFYVNLSVYSVKPSTDTRVSLIWSMLEFQFEPVICFIVW